MEKQLEKPAPVPELNEINEIVTIKEKDLLIENYLPNLSNYEKIIKTFEIKLDHGQKKDSKPYELFPNGNFTKEKGYFIFYNDNLKNLIDLYKAYLGEYIKQHDFALLFKRDNLNKVFKEVGFEYKSEADDSYNPFKLVSGLISYYWKQDIIEKSDILANNLMKLKKAQQDYNNKKICSVQISENLFDEKLNIYYFNIKYINEIESLKNEKIDEIQKLNLFDKKIDELKKEIMPENSRDKMSEFCFVLNIISEYLSNFERSFETKTLDLLKIMNIIRIKLDYFLLDYRYKFVENQSPILNIKIKRYKMLCDSPGKTSIYFEKGEARNFKRNLREELDNKAKNIDSKYLFQDITIDEIINIARNNNFNRLEDIIEGYDNSIRQKNYELENKKNEYITFIAKESLNFVFGDNNNNKINYNNNGVKQEINSSQMNQFLISDTAIKETKDKNTNTTDGEKKESSKEDSEKILEKRKNNLNNLGIDSKNMNNDIIDKISKSFQMLQELNKIKDEIEILEKKKKRISERFNYNLAFFNTLKLFCLMEKKHIEKDDFVGIILEEKNKDKTHELREYSVYKLIGLSI